MVFFMRFYAKPARLSPHFAPASRIWTPFSCAVAAALLLLTACRQETGDHGFRIRRIDISRGYQVLDVRLAAELDLSQKAREALRNGVTLAIRLDLELQSEKNLIAVKRIDRLFQLRYLPLSERYQLTSPAPRMLKTYSRLRYAVADLDALSVKFPSGPLPAGEYELRARIKLDQGRLPAPMQLPAWFSAEWRHDSGWSVWPFKVSA